MVLLSTSSTPPGSSIPSSAPDTTATPTTVASSTPVSSIPTTTSSPSPTTTPIAPTTSTPAQTLIPTPSVSTPTPSVIVVSSTAPVQTSTQIFTSIVTQTPTPAPPDTTVIVTENTSNSNQQTTATPSSTFSAIASPTKHASSSNSKGLSPAGRTAIAVVIPIVVIAVLIVAGIIWYRRRNSNRDAAEERRKEMEAYEYNPNNDPDLPAVGIKDPSVESAGYRGWAGSSGLGRKVSTNASSGVPASSPATTSYMNNGTVSSEHTMNNLATGAAAVGGVAATTGDHNMDRRASNASSNYSQGDGLASSQQYDEYATPYPPANPNPTSFTHSNPYYPPASFDHYGGAAQPVLRESPARKLTHQAPERNNVNSGNRQGSQGSQGGGGGSMIGQGISQNF